MRKRCYVATMQIVRIIIFAMFLAGLQSAATAVAQSAPGTEQIRMMLSGIEHVPSEADWRRIGDGALPILIELYEDRSQPPYIRLRAVSALAYFPRESTHRFLRDVAHTPRQNDLMIRQAVRALQRGFGTEAIEDLIPFLSHEAVTVREATAQALARIDDGRARSALQRRATVEPNAIVREAIESGLRRPSDGRTPRSGRVAP